MATAISLKVLMDKKNSRVIFAESDKDFIDVLFSFLTIPIGTIIRLIRNRPPTVVIGCMNNLYESVEHVDVQQFQTEACKTMLLYPRNGAANQCKSLKLNFFDDEPLRFFLCDRPNCSEYKLSHYINTICGCGGCMNREVSLTEKNCSDVPNTGVFVKGQTRFIITDKLHATPPTTEASLSLLSGIGVTDWSAIEECNLEIGVDEVLTLLKCSLISNTPLTEALLKQNSVRESDKENFEQGSYCKFKMEEPASNGNGKIDIKLIVSESKKMVCYAEASEDFVDLLFSFLTVPLGHMVKEMHSNTSKECCLNHLYSSIQELDAGQFLISSEHNAMLVSPKLAPDFSYGNHLLDIEEYKHPPYYSVHNTSACRYGVDQLISDESLLLLANNILPLTVMDPKSSCKDATRGGFVLRPAMFTVTDDLIITPISPILGLSLLKKLKVPFNDTKECVVNVGREQASRLFVAAFASKSALTSVFFGGPKPEY